MPETQAQQAFNLARSCVAWNDPNTPATRHANQHVERRTYGDGSRLTLWADGMVEWQEENGQPHGAMTAARRLLVSANAPSHLFAQPEETNR